MLSNFAFNLNLRHYIKGKVVNIMWRDDESMPSGMTAGPDTSLLSQLNLSS